MKLRTTLAGIVVLLGPFAAGQACAQASQPGTRGELLYTTHCIACHTTQMHWRDNRQAHDWGSLRAQVTRWQSNAGLGWNAADIGEVAKYLNDTIYRFPQPQQQARRD